jgi:glutaredoxin
MSSEQYDLLLATTQIPGYVSLEYFILANMVGLKEDKTRTIDSLVESFRDMRNKRLLELTNVAFTKRSTSYSNSLSDKPYKFILDSDARSIETRKFLKERILGLYIESYGDELSNVDVSTMSGYEKSELEDMLYNAYNSRKFQGTVFERKINEIKLDQPSEIVVDDGVVLTIGEYINYRVALDNEMYRKLMVRSCVAHRKRCIDVIPGFAHLLANAPLADIKPVVTSPNVIEDLNFEILKQFQPVVIKVVGVKKEVPLDFMKTVIRVFQELVIEVSQVEVKGAPGFLIIDNATCGLIMGSLFPSCYRIAVPTEEIPDELVDFFRKLDEFAEIDHKVFWYYFKAYRMINTDTYTRTVIGAGWRDNEAIKAAVVKAANDLFTRYQTLSRITPDQKLRLALKRKGNVIMYHRPGCPSCIEAKKILSDAEIKIDARDPSSRPPQLIYYKTVPLIVLKNGTVIGGLEDLQRVMAAPQIRPSIMR